MQLIGSLSSPYVRKVRVLIAEKGLDCPLKLEDVWAANTKIQQNNPLGKVPCLILEDGRALYDSRVICEYLDSLPPANTLIPVSGSERIEVLRWQALADGVLDAGVLMRLEQTQREPRERSEKWLTRQRGKVTAGLESMAKELDDREWCAGARFTLADIAAGCALGWLALRLPEIDWRAAQPNLARHYAKLMTRRSFADSVPK
ncbi:MAG: glutathione S-transferase N-terminal domain-containing protein [Gammaproteobacteria bacterium]|nr:glutathione S-transferase N-terminal domain-containing protein [Gammaproteobacteria bacterium]MDE1887566.1 glutathione S-transferase N-terminal domain-containing protein [Gammaproteobacteria bacterium]MDE2023509.1 glutathione S-transferase N-terminal domain-containing protein [Gammaproteobacteria bacterium]MDE2139639.1 glutathione S-transferase N-terminal domain-containing protein [Gammaproteobacteria bacterium]MDE2274308.1 glutathione S-transferase N-terminal domain-containing protein [Gamm